MWIDIQAHRREKLHSTISTIVTIIIVEMYSHVIHL